MPERHPSTWDDDTLRRTGQVSYLPGDMTQIVHVRRLGSVLWAVFKSGDAWVKGPVPRGHLLAEDE